MSFWSIFSLFLKRFSRSSLVFWVFFATQNIAFANEEKPAWDALRSGGIVLFRHALAPGGGDPPGFQLNDCATQRNLSDEGRAQAKRMGDRLKAEGVNVQAVWSSQWCRTLETAQLMALGPPNQVQPKSAFNSLFATPQRQPAQTASAKKLLATHKGPGALVVSTHQVGITGLTGIVPASGEGVVVRMTSSGEVQVVGRVMP